MSADKHHYALAEFGASEVERITGVPKDLQRDWRRRGFIVAEVEGRRATFHTTQVAQTMVRRALSDLGVPLQEAAKASLLGGLMVEQYAWREPDAVEYDADLSAAVAATAQASVETEPAMRYLLIPRPLLTVEAIVAQGAPGAPLADWLPALPAKDDEDLARSITTAKAIGHGDSWSVIDLAALGKRLAQTAERALVTVRPGKGKSDTRNTAVAALTGQE